jgi:hypothetical protein
MYRFILHLYRSLCTVRIILKMHNLELCNLIHQVTNNNTSKVASSVGTGNLSSGVKRPRREANLYLVLRLRMRGAIPQLSHTSAWHGA